MVYKNILVSLCGKGDESIVINEAINIADGGQLSFVHVNDLHAGEMSMMMDAPDKKYEEADIKEWVESVNKNIAEKSNYIVLTSESVSKAIGDATSDMDLLILGHRKQSFFKHHFFDSVDEGIVNTSTCPVLVVPK
jgi:nucleotide-binding universal stress UspA family protein